VKLVIQRVARAAVRVGDETVSAIGRGLLILHGVAVGDGEAQVDALVRKATGLRIFDDAAGKMNLSCEDVDGGFLVVSQFTLLADLSKGKRPGFEAAMRPPESERLYDLFCERLAASTGRPVKKGRFGATMMVELVNEGPGTFIIEAQK